MNGWLVALMWALVSLDCALMGYRLSMGQSALLDKRRYHLERSFQALALAQVPLAAVTGLAAVLAATGPPDLAPSFDEAMGRLLLIAGPYAAAILMTTALCLIPSVVVRTAASVVIFGPVTLLRPYVVTAAVLFAVIPDARWQIVTVGLLVLVPGVLLEPLLDRRLARNVLGRMAAAVG